MKSHVTRTSQALQPGCAQYDVDVVAKVDQERVEGVCVDVDPQWHCECHRAAWHLISVADNDGGVDVSFAKADGMGEVDVDDALWVELKSTRTWTSDSRTVP